MRVSVEWLKELVPFRTAPKTLADQLTLAGLEIKSVGESRGGPYYEAEITSNRPDWLSHFGVAREIAALTKRPLAPFSIEKRWTEQPAREWALDLRDRSACPYYTGVTLSGVSNVETPEFMVKRLEACGQRSISFLVDVTNYVLLLTGQPLHAFDADHLQGKLIQIRSARAGETFISIKGNALRLEEEDLVIADQDNPVALAGVMGGKSSEISEATQNVFLESAFFAPSRVRRTSQRTGLKTDSSYRFERGVDPNMVDQARDFAVQLICQYAKPSSVSAVYRAGKVPASKPLWISLSAEDIESCLGLKIPLSSCVSILKNLGLSVLKKGSKIMAAVPSFRTDLTRTVDLIEEVARIYGYDKIPESLNLGAPIPQDPVLRLTRLLEEGTRDFFSVQGYFETVTFSLVQDPGPVPAILKADHPVTIRNPQIQELHQMRRTLLHSHLGVIRHNLHHQADSVRLFEIANVYSIHKADIMEEKHLAVALTGKLKPANWKDGSRAATFFDLKGLVDIYLRERCGLSAIRFEAGPQNAWLAETVCQVIRSENETLGWIGQVHPSLAKSLDLEEPVYYAELSLPALLHQAPQSVRVQDIPRYPSVERDIAFLLDETVPAGALADEIRRQGGALVRSVELFDCFQGGRIPKGKKNLAFRILYQLPDRTLLTEEVHELHFRIANLIQERFQASFQ